MALQMFYIPTVLPRGYTNHPLCELHGYCDNSLPDSDLKHDAGLSSCGSKGLKSLVTECHLPECDLRSITEAPEEASQEKTPCAGCHCRQRWPRAALWSFCCGGRAGPAVPPSFLRCQQVAIPQSPVRELSPPPTSHRRSPLLPLTLDTRHQTGVGAHLACSDSCESSFPQPTPFLWASLPRGQPRGDLCLASLMMARKSCQPGLEPPRA